MEGIEFEKEVSRPVPMEHAALKKSWAIQLVIKISGGKIGEQKASYILLVFALFLIIFSIYNFAFSGNKNTSSESETSRQKSMMEQQLRSN